MNEALLDAFRHNAWATQELIAACRGLSDEQLGAPATGAFGGILDTFNHLVSSDAHYLHSLSGTGPGWLADRGETVGLDELSARAEETAPLWERFLAQPLDGERLLVLDEGMYEAHAGVVVAQALYHATAHREQICTTLTGLGIQPPAIQPWEYAEASGRGRERQQAR